jgi:outer membrane protein OmpA-like peptidoglycan-associated protein
MGIRIEEPATLRAHSATCLFTILGAAALTAAAVIACLGTSPAHAGEFGARIDAAPSLPVTNPQRAVYGLGPDLRATGFWAAHPALDLQVELGFGFWPTRSSGPARAPTSIVLAGAGVRLKRPTIHETLVPWLAVTASYVLSGTASRVGMSATVGLALRLSERSDFLLGPVLRYQHVLALAGEPNFPSFDAGVLSFGIAVEYWFRSPRARSEPLPPPPPPPPLSDDPAARLAGTDPDPDRDGLTGAGDECPDASGPSETRGCPDADLDGVADRADHCPSEAGLVKHDGCPDSDGDDLPDVRDACPRVAGLTSSAGCPEYRKVVVTTSRIEILQKIYFAFGLARIMPRSFPLLDEVVQAVKDHEAICVRIEGHTDNVGRQDANARLSQDRAAAVLEYLVRNGVAPRRLVSRGYGDTLPRDTNATTAGRESNRRVEFVITSCGAMGTD